MSNSIQSDHNNNSHTGRDLVSVGIFTVIIAFINFVCNIIGVFGPEIQPVGGVIAVIINGIPFALFVRRINTFGLVTTMAVLLSLIFTLAGDSIVALPIALALGLIADLIIRSGGYSTAGRTILGYAFFGIYPVGSVLPLLFMRDAMIERFAERSDAEWAERFSDFLSTPVLLGLVIVMFVGALFGGWLGQKALKNYFSRAGM